ncbi:MAG TPA: hypothetical protein VLS49_08525 [Usitatibacter sp.]|nr:hypothetical protein [Usitatibacter sp.]
MNPFAASSRAHDVDSAQPAPEPAVLRPVASREDWAAVRALRFAALWRAGDLAPSGVPTYGDAHDAVPGAVTFLLLERGRATGSTRCMHACGDDRRAPSVEAFRGELDKAIASAPIVEASLTVVHGATDRALALLSLFRVHMAACAALDAEWLLAPVRECEMGFYRRVFEMDILTGSARWPGLALPRVLMGLPYRERAARLYARLPILAPSGADLRGFRAGAELVLDEEARRSPSRAAGGDACA